MWDHFTALKSIDGELSLSDVSNLYSLLYSFPSLHTIKEGISIVNNPRLVDLGEIPLQFLGANTLGQSVFIQSNPPLVSLGETFSQLTNLTGTITIQDNPNLVNFDGFRNLICHGGVTGESTGEIPLWLRDLPSCS